ncbi:signal peptidase II [Ignatzschineria cameli]|uniref:Lipoprotein signal peptidase n=1 Tax=Ignatzschineria cameli TaxID=2182793 RepID=A0A2U2ART9_9GAMM|nr:signal peptidase II [Ignatzschineria cameli]PWD86662.1 signal peptidase II [Ignatzschineria cameli]PWD86985.1 signal peptidase II [Ignatzschineria cameli]PWD91958.1 signal peptidase II [Ignatzschineria cameli]PWD93456.1 signal peptidase II [Ignatzschineria cameli]PWD94198.1 signal peptidase II [Ignatzschineria cameli]
MRKSSHQEKPVNIYFWTIFVMAGVLLDFGTKYAAEHLLLYGESIPVFKGLSWTLVYNPGSAFSFLANQGGWQRWFFVAITVVISLILFFWIKRTSPAEKLLRLGLAAVLVGAIGNLIDRVVLGHVVDFIHVYIRDWHFPIFNVADIFVTTGVVFILLSSFTEKRQQREEQQS